MPIKKTIVIDVKEEQAVKDVKKVDKSLKGATKSTENLSTGALASAKSFKFMGISINGVSKQLKILKISLIATGIGAIAVAVGTLAAAFLSTQQGANFLTKALEPLKEVMATMWGVVQNLGKGLAKIVSGDIIGGWEEMGDAVSGLSGKMTEAWERGNQLSETIIGLQASEAEYITSIGKLRLESAKQQAIIEDDENKSIEKRKEALAALSIVNDQIFQKTSDRAKEELKILRLRTEANDTDFAAKNEIARKEVELLEAQSAREKEQKKEFSLARKLKGGSGGDPAEDDIRDLISPITGLSTNELAEIGELQGVIIDENNNFGKAQNDLRNNLEEEAAKNRMEIDEIEFENKQKLLGGVAAGLGALSDIAGRETTTGKALAVASSLINTYAAITGQLKASATSPGAAVPGYAIAQAIATGLAGFAAVKNILKVQVPGGGGAGGGSLGPGPESIAQAAPSFNVVGASETNQLAQTINNQQDRPVKAFVVSKDVSSQQELDRNLESTASFG